MVFLLQVLDLKYIMVRSKCSVSLETIPESNTISLVARVYDIKEEKECLTSIKQCA